VTAVVARVAFAWLGMVLAISFLEAPLKFRAPDVTLRIGLGIGRRCPSCEAAHDQAPVVPVWRNR